MVAFPYSNLQFDSGNPPLEVFVAIQIANYRFMYVSGVQHQIKIFPAQNLTGSWEEMKVPIPYAQLYG